MTRNPILIVIVTAALASPASAARSGETQTAAGMDMIKACNEFPKGHPYSCEKLAAMDTIKACNEFPKGHPYSCEALAKMDLIKACNELPPDHPYGCRRLLSLVPKCPPGTVPGVDCRHMLVKNEGEKGFLADGEGNKLSAGTLKVVQAADLSGVFAK